MVALLMDFNRLGAMVAHLHRAFGIFLLAWLLGGCREKPAGDADTSTRKAPRFEPFKYGESPFLAALVRRGELPSVEERLPEAPMMVQPVEKVGTYGGTWHMALVGDADHNLLTRTIGYEQLLRWDSQWNRVIPNLAESLETNASQTEFTFHLRKGLRWSDGKPFSADDILFWYEHVLCSPGLAPTASHWWSADGRRVVVEKIDALTVKFRFSATQSLFLLRMASPDGEEPTAYPAHYLSRFHPAFNYRAQAEARAAGFDRWESWFLSKAGQSFGSPSRWLNAALPRLTAWIPQTGYEGRSKVIAVRNPFYWKVDTAGSQLPYIDQVEFTQCQSESEVIALAVGGKLDMQDRHLDQAAALPAIQAAAQQGVIRTFKTIPSSCNVAACFLNLTHTNAFKRALFQQLSFRKALSLSLDRERIIREVYGGAGRPFQVGPRPESPYFHNRLGNQYTQQDLKTAEREFRGAGLTAVGPDGWRRDARGDVVRFELSLSDFHASVIRTAGLLAEDWRAQGIDCQLRVLPVAQFARCLKMNQHDAALMPGEGGLDFLTEPVHILPLSSLSAFGIGWAGAEVE